MTKLIASRQVACGSGESGHHVAPAAILIDGSRIREVRPLSAAGFEDELAAWGAELGTTASSFGDRLITPAFVNPHTHLSLGFLRGFTEREVLEGNMVRQLYFEIESRLEPEDVLAFSRMGAYESLLQGVGLVWDHYYHGAAIVEALCDTGLSGVVAPTLQDISGPGMAQSRQQIAATLEIVGSADLGERGIFAALGPHATDTASGELWREAAEIAESHTLPIHAHLAQSIEEYRFSVQRRGATPLRWLVSLGVLERVPRWVFAHCLFASRPELALLDPDRVLLIFCPHAQLVFAFPADPGSFSEAGLPWAVATDCSPSNDSMNLQKELRYVAGQRSMGTTWSSDYRRFLAEGAQRDAESTWSARGEHFARAADQAAPERLLDRVWRIPGEGHPAFRAGVLEERALANLLVWDLEHPAFWPERPGLNALAMGDTTQAIHAMYVAGRLIGEAGDFHRSLLESDDYRRSLEQATKRRRALL